MEKYFYSMLSYAKNLIRSMYPDDVSYINRLTKLDASNIIPNAQQRKSQHIISHNFLML